VSVCILTGELLCLHAAEWTTFYFDESGTVYICVARDNENVHFFKDEKWYCVLLILLSFNSLYVTTSYNQLCLVPLSIACVCLLRGIS